jgi:hypothetical protein
MQSSVYWNTFEDVKTSPALRFSQPITVPIAGAFSKNKAERSYPLLFKISDPSVIIDDQRPMELG